MKMCVYVFDEKMTAVMAVAEKPVERTDQVGVCCNLHCSGRKVLLAFSIDSHRILTFTSPLHLIIYFDHVEHLSKCKHHLFQFFIPLSSPSIFCCRQFCWKTHSRTLNYDCHSLLFVALPPRLSAGLQLFSSSLTFLFKCQVH